ncbi:uncharacterized protein [Epargyreus clarus]|uniref:uncharacterized protein isoform X1 n=1 Tax=Epargyreus clarus TaxID=520877 RepID=UPI003C2CF7A4
MDIEEIILKIKVPTPEVKVEDIQEVLKKIKQAENITTDKDGMDKYYLEILEILWTHMEKGFKEFDDQLLCSTYFYTILTFSNEKEVYLGKVLELVKHEIKLKEEKIEASDNISRTIALIYGIFQSTILQKSDDTKPSHLPAILKDIFNLLRLMSYVYSQYTFLTFKIMTFFKKVVGTNLQEILFNKEYNYTLLNVINHNWENPITGVRSLNKIIFHNLISVVDEDMHGFILQQLNGFYWNKAKYLMFAEVIEKYQGNVEELIDKYDLVKGLIYSLHKAGLVSAGTDMYINIVKRLNAHDKWCTIFLHQIMEIIKGSSKKPIENFNNYWCLNTIKKFPSLIRIIVDEVENLNNVENKLYSCLTIMQQSNRLGLLEKYFSGSQIELHVLNGIEHIDSSIRALSFDIVCSSHGKFLPEQNEYNLILDFLKNNVNSDCSVLRINMMKSLHNFLIQLNVMFVNCYKSGKDYDVDDLKSFCMSLQTFIKESLNYNGNYQRKIATIQVAKALIISFKEVPRKKQKQTRQFNTTLIDFLKSEKLWILSENHFVLKLINLLKDPSVDIREHAMEVLLHNYSDQLCSDFIENLIEEASLCLKSRFFYQITCGHTIFKLVVNLLLIEKCTEGRYKNVEDVFEFALGVVKSECDSKIDIVKSIDEGKQLHSYLSILHIIFQVCLEKSYKLNISLNAITLLLDMLKTISNQFVWEKESLVSSDFSKMNDMVQEMIANSGHKISHHDNETNISGLHQVVLNCLWLNVKASCELSSILISYFNDDAHKDVCEQCLRIICNVLETSRHKGAIEAGGSALGQAIQKLTSSPEGSMISEIPMMLLKSKLNELISETSNMASVTRRGAGLSIMIHRIVSSDMKKGKPLFHYFMQVLLATCNKLPQPSTNENDIDTSNEKDLPKAIYIHFLTRIVTDSSLASDMMYYSAKLAEVAFDNLNSSCWQIRNAALQLYGSLIPKLIGQKKNSGASEEVIATVAVDEFRTHSPKLWEYMVKQLKNSTESCDVVHTHNNLVPILSILANMAPMYSFSNENELDEELLPSLISLLGSPIYVVRRLTAKCLLNIYPFQDILNVLLNSSCQTENCLHGSLLLLNEFIKQYKGKKDLIENMETLKMKYHNQLISRNHSYLCRESFEYIFPESINLTDQMMRETLLEMNRYQYAQGIFQWANFRVQYFLENASWITIPPIVALISDCSDFEKYCETLCKRIKQERNVSEKILFSICNTLYSLGFSRKSAVLWKLLNKILLHTELLSEHLDTSLLHQYLAQNKVSYRMRYMLPFAARVLKNTNELLCVSTIIFKLCSPETSDVDMRLMAATANNELASKFNSLSDMAKINAIKATVMFLQDEDETVRNLSVHFYSQVNMKKIATHPYICLKNILNHDFLNNVIKDSSTGIQSICNDLQELLKGLTISIEDEYNPFVNESKNIYLEPEILIQLLDKLKTV